ncbi:MULTISPECIES: hypothetical protein [Empedobacter]|uniref:DUF7832 domain-containing protein n=1 Tax=Empedobacter TaxID=59734 RepID=UPI0021AB270D|nr:MULTISPECIES: hypothetical protein [Empedobacter]MDH2206830.1 hypothetical protein [Empedobacter sp. GD03644]
MKKIFLLIVLVLNVNCLKQKESSSKEISKYDDASWHYGNDFPKDLAQENASTHIGMYMKWCIDNDLISSELKKDSQAGIDSVKNNIITGAEFINSYSDGKFLSTDLSDIGRKFTNDYYEDNSDFSKNNGSYLDDYIKIFEKIIDKKSVYHVEDSEQNYLLIKAKIDSKFKEWKKIYF